MKFPETNSLVPFVKSYYNKNIRPHVRTKKEIIYYPKDCSDQMASLVKEYMEEKLKINVKKLKKNRKGVYNLELTYNN